VLQDVVPDHVIKTTKPRFVGVTADIYAVGKFDSAGSHVLHVQIYVEDEIADLLHSPPCHPLGAGLLGKVLLTSVAIWNARTDDGLLLNFWGIATKLNRPAPAS
jgi:hypothetical protein